MAKGGRSGAEGNMDREASREQLWTRDPLGHPCDGRLRKQGQEVPCTGVCVCVFV